MKNLWKKLDANLNGLTEIARNARKWKKVSINEYTEKYLLKQC